MSHAGSVSLTLLCAWAPLQAQNAKPFDAASAFGARPSVTSLALSPDGTSVAYIVPADGQGSVAYTLALAKGSEPKRALSADGKSYRLEWCQWVANDRLVCGLYKHLNDPTYGPMPVSHAVAVNADGSNLRELSLHSNTYSRGFNLYGGDIIDWLPDENGAVMMTRNYLPDDHLGTRLASSEQGLGVDRIDTRTLAVRRIEPPRVEAVAYFTDGHGAVRIMTVHTSWGWHQETGVVTHLYRSPGSRQWHTLATYKAADHSGFNLYAVDRARNVAYGFKKKDGRQALYSIALDESRREELVYARPEVDVDELIRVGRHRRVVGTSWALQRRGAQYFALDIAQLLTSLAQSLPQPTSLQITDASLDENRMLLFAGSDTRPGAYYIFDRQANQLDAFRVVRSQLEGVALAEVRPVTYQASDGIAIPGYLTLPPGHESAKGRQPSSCRTVALATAMSGGSTGSRSITPRAASRFCSPTTAARAAMGRNGRRRTPIGPGALPPQTSSMPAAGSCAKASPTPANSPSRAGRTAAMSPCNPRWSIPRCSRPWSPLPPSPT
jgi:hypothetical protein